MSEFMRKLRERVDEAVKPHIDMYGADAPVVKMAHRILAEAEAVEEELAEERVSSERAAEVKGWNVQTLQHYARKRLAGEALQGAWKDLRVEETSSGYVFVLGTIPDKLKASA